MLRNGRGVKGEREIDDEKAKTIHKTFVLYAHGHSRGSIVATMNEQQIPSPTGGLWTKQSINGNRKRRGGILNNEIYRGRRIWNMKSLRMNPETGKKKYVMPPPVRVGSRLSGAFADHF
ncbi:MAG: recombinase family protein [Alphaproteobacteria bacterium]|nr:recombinase family protein [Alphaproteobacteria bacterium]